MYPALECLSVCCVCCAGDTLAESAHARLLSGTQLLPVSTRRHVGRRHWLSRIHLGTRSDYSIILGVQELWNNMRPSALRLGPIEPSRRQWCSANIRSRRFSLSVTSRPSYDDHEYDSSSDSEEREFALQLPLCGPVQSICGAHRNGVPCVSSYSRIT